MNQVQRFLYTKASRVLECKRVKKRKIIFLNEVTGSTFLERSVFINRFDGTFAPSEIQTENYCSSFFCDVEQADFWDFLYSDRWNDKGFLRILSGELYTTLDFRFKEMLQADEISQHVTFAYLKVCSEEEKEKKMIDLSPETVRVDFTYYNRKKGEKIEFRRECNPDDTEIPSSASLNSEDPEFSPDISSLINLSEEHSELRTESVLQLNRTMSGVMAPAPTHLININLEHFPCPMSRDIDNDAESLCSSLENEIQKGDWITKEELWRIDHRPNKFKSVIQVSRWVARKQTRRKTLSNKTSRTDMDVPEVDMKERLLMPISIDINLSVLGRIMEREKLLKFKNMSSKERKKFFLSDERLIKMHQKLKGDKNFEIPEHSSRRPSRRKEKIKVKNMQKFALLVLGITDSPAIYQTLVWLGRCEEEEKTKIPESKILRSRHAGFGGDEVDDDEVSDEIELKKESFKLRNTRSLVRTHTLHPKIFKPHKEVPALNIHRLLRSYSEDFYGKLYSWEKNADCKFHFSRTKISVPDFALKRLEISSEMILKALNDFIVRKERVISSKGATFISIAFIRPVCLNNLFF